MGAQTLCSSSYDSYVGIHSLFLNLRILLFDLYKSEEGSVVVSRPTRRLLPYESKFSAGCPTNL